MPGVPLHLQPGLERYLLHGITPGRFLKAVLANDLVGAIHAGDEESLAGLTGLVMFLYNEVPGSAWGNLEKMRVWQSFPDAERARLVEMAQ